MESPRGIDLNLVNSQQARRILDRLVGFELSPLLWKKIKGGLSAGRVQSVAVRLVVEREREIDKFKIESSFKVVALFSLPDNKVLKAELPKKNNHRRRESTVLRKLYRSPIHHRKFGDQASEKITFSSFYHFYLATRSVQKVRLLSV